MAHTHEVARASRAGASGDSVQKACGGAPRPRKPMLGTKRYMGDRVARLFALRDKVPGGFTCLAGCSDCCTLAFMTVVERDRILAIGGVKRVQPDYGDCQYLDGHRCSVYAERPLVCRLFGLTDAMPCPHGIQPDGPMMPEADFDRIMGEYHDTVGPDDVSTIGEAVYPVVVDCKTRDGQNVG